MKTLKGHLEDKLQHDRFRKLFSEEKQLAQLSMQILEVRQRLGLSQREVAEKAKLLSSSYPIWSMGLIAMFRRFSRYATHWEYSSH